MCLIIDVQLPGIDGFALRRRLAAKGALPPAIFITAFDEPEARAGGGCRRHVRREAIFGTVAAAGDPRLPARCGARRRRADAMSAGERIASAFAAGAMLLFSMHSHAQVQSGEDLAKKPDNPVSSLVSVPFQFNWDHEIGPNRDGRKFTLNIQPVVLSADWTLISRVIVPIVDQHVPALGEGSQSGAGDINGEFFYVPSAPGPGGILWGAGPDVVVPTNTDLIGGGKWALGPTGVVVKEEAGWT